MTISIVLSSRECKLIEQALRCAFDHYAADEFEQLADWLAISEMCTNESEEVKTREPVVSSTTQFKNWISSKEAC